MICPHCGAPSAVVTTSPREEEYRTLFARRCDNGHRFSTAEVPLTLLADKRETACALRNIERRVALYNRNMAIAQDTRLAKVVAADYGITDARVRQIRASLLPRDEQARFAKIASNLERIGR